MCSVEVQGKIFEKYITAQQIEDAVYKVAQQINKDYAGKEPLFIVVLNGAFIYAADLFRKIELPSQVTFVRLQSYSGMETSGNVREMIGLNEDVEGRDVIVVEDIIDTGTSMKHFMESLKAKGVRSIALTTMLFKPDALLYKEATPKYIGIEIPKDFIVGYGMDLDGYARNLDAIYVIKK
ncbi:MAG: hypoxanthine phosphoribosyltransferase [Paludibacteraceae bacterium]|nr:hypoxanthine phosphoribosyltransferase [Paludibacteraceae bacterium]